MKTLSLFKSLGPLDAKNIGRDSLLLWIPLIPIIIALLLRTAVPALTQFLLEEYSFDLVPYYPLFLSFFITMTPSVGGMIIGFLLLDERDDQILRALMVTPMSLTSYLLYRLSLPLLLGGVTTVVIYPLIGLMPLSIGRLILLSLIAALSGPIIALFLASFAENKVAGFAMMKVANALAILPIMAYFVSEPWQWLAGLIPTYWPLKLYWLMVEGNAYFGAAAVGLAINFIAIYLLLRHFKRVIYRQ